MSRGWRNLLAFLLGVFIAAVLIFASSANAAVTVIPDVPGYTPTSSGFTPSAGQLKDWAGTYDTSAKSYPTTGKITLMSKAPLSIPAKVGLASGAGAAIKAGLRLNPWAIAGTLAAGWLIDQGIQLVDGVYYKGGESLAGYYYTCPVCTSGIKHPVVQGAADETRVKLDSEGNGPWTIVSYAPDGVTVHYKDGTGYPVDYAMGRQPGCSDGYAYTGGQCIAPSVPATPADFDALPDPTLDDGVAAEAPSAPYMPSGVPVNPPQYTSGNYPVGSPYKAPDGSTVQPMASVTNNYSTTNHSVTVATYNITTHNSSGVPLDNPEPVPTPEEEKQDHCVANPESVGCQKLGEYDHPIPTAEHVFEFEPEAVNMGSSCPADIQVLGSALSFASACGAMSTIKPLVVGMASVMSAFLLFGGMRGAD